MKQTLSVKIAPELKDRLAQLALTKDRSIHWLLTQAITRYVEQEERRESIKAA
ncbi:TPA: CopG family ribbon-helix-helix protein, partial [Yersinia enterocolitica]